MTIFYIPNPTQYLNITTTLLNINKQQISLLGIRSSLRQKSLLMVCQWQELDFKIKCDQ